MNIEEKVMGRYILKDGSKYIFLEDRTVYKEEMSGKLTQIKLNKKSIEKIQENIGEGNTDIER